MANFQLILEDSRRLTGPHLLGDRPGAIIDVKVDNLPLVEVASVWQQQARQLLDGVGWQQHTSFCRYFTQGISLGISAPLDALYTACELNEAAWKRTCEILKQQSQTELTGLIEILKQQITDEQNPSLLALIQAAEQQNVPWLVDDDLFTLGYGPYAHSWAVSSLPDPKRLDWSGYQGIPLGLVTGTNGKSTSVRLTAHIIRQGNHRCGLTSTDGIQIGDHFIDRGDYSGPGGARALLRHPDTEMALLEVARGGLLRRGLPVPTADAALITNIAADHLGQYGINDLPALAQAKGLVAKAVKCGGLLILNGDDPELVAFAESLNQPIGWFALEETNPRIRQHQQSGQPVSFVRQGIIHYQEDHCYEALIAVNDIPMTFNGAATHNVQNALGAVMLAKSLGIDNQQICQGLQTFQSNVADNPGRGNLFMIQGATVMMDFAHNVHSMAAMASTLKGMPGRRRTLLLSAAGDRSDEETREMVTTAMGMQPDRLIVAELDDYRRGRAPGEIPALIRQTAIEAGMAPEEITLCDSPLAGSQQVLEKLEPDDLALLMVLSQRDEIVELLNNTT